MSPTSPAPRAEQEKAQVADHPCHQGSPRQHPGQPIAQVRGVLAEGVVISTSLDPFLSLRALATYSGLSVRILRGYLTDPAHSLPHYRIGGKIVVRRSEYDAWAAQFKALRDQSVEQIVADVLADLQGPPRRKGA